MDPKSLVSVLRGRVRLDLELAEPDPLAEKVKPPEALLHDRPLSLDLDLADSVLMDLGHLAGKGKRLEDRLHDHLLSQALVHSEKKGKLSEALLHDPPLSLDLDLADSVLMDLGHLAGKGKRLEDRLHDHLLSRVLVHPVLLKKKGRPQ